MKFMVFIFIISSAVQAQDTHEHPTAENLLTKVQGVKDYLLRVNNKFATLSLQIYAGESYNKEFENEKKINNLPKLHELQLQMNQPPKMGYSKTDQDCKDIFDKARKSATIGLPYLYGKRVNSKIGAVHDKLKIIYKSLSDTEYQLKFPQYYRMNVEELDLLTKLNEMERSLANYWDILDKAEANSVAEIDKDMLETYIFQRIIDPVEKCYNWIFT